MANITLQKQQQLTGYAGLYVPVSIEANDIYCGDDRPPLDQQVAYIHLFGGGLNESFNLLVLEETAEPGSVQEKIEDRVGVDVKILEHDGGLRVGVHSDVDHEEGDTLKTDKSEGDVGCKYWQARRDISRLVAENGEELLERAQELRPELFESEESIEAGREIISAHQRLASRNGVFSSGRAVVLKAVEAGARTVILKGEHNTNRGIVNLVPNTTLDTAAAVEAGLPAYEDDAWVSAEVFDRLKDHYPYDAETHEIAHLIDTLAVFKALGVTDIRVRRPEAA